MLGLANKNKYGLEGIIMYNIIKRLIDITISFSVLLVLSPLLFILAILLKLSAEHDVFYAQERIGYKNKKFKLYKFVTMRKSSSTSQDYEYSTDKYSRVTYIGKYLRLTKINELPQLFNVLKGDMSLVGPRPLITESFEMYSDEVKNKLYNLKPGLTGVGSIIFRDEEKLFSGTGTNYKEYYKENIIPYKGTLETWYYDNKSMRLDLIIILITAKAVLLPKLNLHYKVLRTLPQQREQKISLSEKNFEKQVNFTIKN